MNQLIDKLIELAYAEDIGDGDHSTLCSVPADALGKAKLLIKEEGILAGVDIARRIFNKLDGDLTVDIFLNDGAHVRPGDIAFVVEGKVRSILQAERLVLNMMQRMSGIATTTNRYVRLVAGTRAKVLDTRKTTPGMRMLEKQAVRIGGGVNHRVGLYDMILLKDNHVDFCGGVTNAIRRAQHYLQEKNKTLKIEIEVRTLDELDEAIAAGGIHRVLLDNFSLKDTRKAVEYVNGRVALESSGGITIETIRSYAETGVDYISVGALTHSVKSLDMSLKAI